MQNYYKTSGKFNPLGVILLAVSVAALGSILSVLYLFINEKVSMVYLCILAALGYGAALGFAGAFLVKIFKVRNPAVAVIGVIVGCLLCSYFKWSQYVSNDYIRLLNNHIEIYGSGELNAYDELLATPFDYTDDAEGLIKEMQSITAYEYYGGDEYFGTYEYEDEAEVAEVNDLKSMSWYEYEGYGVLLGNDVKKAVQNLKKSADMTVNEYINTVIKNNISAVTIMTNPSFLMLSIAEINEEGRWSYSSSNRSDGDLIKGIPLAIVWVIEWFVICLPALYLTFIGASKPFIERDGKWAVQYKGPKLMLSFPDNSKNYKTDIRASTEALLGFEGIEVTGVTDYISVNVYHSDDYTENYLELILNKYNKSKRNFSSSGYLKYLRVEKEFLTRLFKHCKVVPEYPVHDTVDGNGVPIPAGLSGMGAMQELELNFSRPYTETTEKTETSSVEELEKNPLL